VRLLTAGWVVPVSAPPIRGGRVAVEGGRLVWVGAADDPDQPGAPLTDLGPGVLLPGLVNAHTHLELSHLEGRLPGRRGFVDWVRGVVEGRDVEPERARQAAARAIRGLEESGTVAVGDVSNTLGHLDLLEGSSLRAVVFHELLAWDPKLAETVVRRAQQRLAGLSSEAGERRVEIRLAAHAPHSVSAALFAELRKAGGIGSIHLAESREESELLATGGGEWASFLVERGLGGVRFAPPGCSPVRHLERLGVLAPGLVAVHCVQVDEDDCHTLRQSGVHVALCVRSNERLGVGLPPVPRLLELGVPLCLGTDSLASVDSLNMEDEMHAVRRAYPDLPAASIVEMATLGGARALGLPDLGTLAPGQTAALAYADVDRCPDDPYDLLVSGQAEIRGHNTNFSEAGDATP
jgi:aminodeoxyfutalosine deaminase